MKTADLFAGFGGFTDGAKAAGADVVYAANHWPVAVRVHRENHPHVQHECQDIMQANWSKLPRFELLLAGPACQGHSMASQPRRGPQHDAMRTTAWAVVDCADVCEPKHLIVENVPMFLKWRLFDSWIHALKNLDYHITVQVLRASKCGVPQRRDRLFVVGSKKRPIHLFDGGTQEPAFRDCIDEAAGGWRLIAKAGADARDRMTAAALWRGGECLVQHITGHRGISLDEPIRTITTKRQWCIVRGDQYRWLTPREMARGMSFPDSYVLPNDLPATILFKGIGNAIPKLLAKRAVEQVLEAA